MNPETLLTKAHTIAFYILALAFGLLTIIHSWNYAAGMIGADALKVQIEETHATKDEWNDPKDMSPKEFVLDQREKRTERRETLEEEYQPKTFFDWFGFWLD